MSIAESSSTARLTQATPPDRDRYVDLLRVMSLGVVVVGHWLMVVVEAQPDGGVRTTNLLAVRPGLQPVTWLLQIMPIFFLVGGFSHAVALASLRRRGGSYVDFVRSRAGRLLRPTAVFVAAWLGFALALDIAGLRSGVLTLATRTAAQPLWFIGVYLAVVALAPAMLRLHRRLGNRSGAVPVVLAFGVAAVDLLRFGAHVPQIGQVNVLLVWLAVHQLGFCYADGTLYRAGRRLGVALAAGGLTATAVLCAYGPYPVSMVGMPGAAVSNMSPPTVALLTHAVWLTGLVLVLRAPVNRWLRRPRVWRRVVAANGFAMTAFLWHLTAMFAAMAALLAADMAGPAAGSPGWWLLRPLWIALLAVITAALVAAFSWADRPQPICLSIPAARVSAARTAIAAAGTAVAAARTAIAAAGVVAAAIGILGLSAAGFGGIVGGRTATLVVLPVTPLSTAALTAAGTALLRAAGPRPVAARAATTMFTSGDPMTR